MTGGRHRAPDSDLDLKADHVATTSALVGLEPPRLTFGRVELVEGVEIDYSTNELAHALSGIVNGNGNFLERVLGRAVSAGSPLLDELRPLAAATLSRRVHRHYRCFAMNQLRLLEREPTAKRLLYVLRTALTRAHVLRTGELEPELTRLIDDLHLGAARSLVEAKLSGERAAIDASLLEAWRPRLSAMLEGLDEAAQSSPLPEQPRGLEALSAWLVGVRGARFG